MTLNESITIVERIKELYGEKFPGLTEDGTRLWQTNLAYVPLAMVLQSIERYYAEHPYYPPSLKAIMDITGDIECEQERIRASARPSTPEASPVTVLASAALQQQGSLREWAHGHVLILERAGRRRLNFPDTAAFCRGELTRLSPHLSADWERAAQWWEQQEVLRQEREQQRKEDPYVTF